MSEVKPYVYRCEHRVTKRFYIGYRHANVVPADLDFGYSYFTSCPEVSDNFSEYDFEILSEYPSEIWAYETEQRLLYECRNDPLLINKNFKKKGLIALNPKPVLSENNTPYYAIKGKKKKIRTIDPIVVERKLAKIKKKAARTAREKWVKRMTGLGLSKEKAESLWLEKEKGKD